MTPARVVLGLGFGDEGKGATVDWLTREEEGTPLVVRFNGGAQAAHNVITREGQHHTFSQFGSGHLAGARTFLSRFCIVNPLNMNREAAHLRCLTGEDPYDRLVVDEDALVVTPYQAVANRAKARASGLGTCGQGIGETVADDLDGVRIRVGDLCQKGLQKRLAELRNYKVKQLADLGLTPSNLTDRLHLTQDGLDLLADAYEAWADHVQIRPGIPYLYGKVREDTPLIFEGAQGVLLDQDLGIGAPDHATWSDCTPANALTLAIEAGVNEMQILGVMRSYMTRHGPGPFPTEDPEMSEADFPERHNGYNVWQKDWRRGTLDLNALWYAVRCFSGGLDGLIVTHMDHVTYPWPAATSTIMSNPRPETEGGYLYHEFSTQRSLLHGISEKLQAPIVNYSDGPTAWDRTRWFDKPRTRILQWASAPLAQWTRAAGS